MTYYYSIQLVIGYGNTVKYCGTVLHECHQLSKDSQLYSTENIVEISKLEGKDIVLKAVEWPHKLIA